MKKINALFVNRKGKGSYNEVVEFNDFAELQQKVEAILVDGNFPFSKVTLELEPVDWVPNEEEQEKLTEIEKG